jgi:hypothetical protein
MGKVGEREHVWVLFCEESSEKSPKNLLGGESSSGEMIKLTIPIQKLRNKSRVSKNKDGSG